MRFSFTAEKEALDSGIPETLNISLCNEVSTE